MLLSLCDMQPNISTFSIFEIKSLALKLNGNTFQLDESQPQRANKMVSMDGR